MRIDLHCHTIKAKTGDGGRDIEPGDFAEALASNQVGIAAITNHNLFDFKEYAQCVAAAAAKGIDVWPGIELDIRGKSGAEGHVIVIADPKHADKFSEVCESLIGGVSPDSFILDWGKLAPAFVGQGFEFIVISHYRPFKGKPFKDKALPHADNLALRGSFPSNTPFFFEPSNLKRVGIMYAEGVNCLIGSDVKDWSQYSECSLPEIKLEVNEFHQFLLLLRKTPEVLKTIMNKKSSEQVEIDLFEDGAPLAFPIYNDVNVVFGAKGTGKTALLKEIESHYRAKGWTDVSAYYASENTETYKQMIAVKPVEGDFAKLGMGDGSDDFSYLKEWNEAAVTPISSYLNWEEYIAKKEDTERFGFALASAPVEPDLDSIDVLLSEYRVFSSSARQFIESRILTDSLPVEELDDLRDAVHRACLRVQAFVRSVFIDAHALKLEVFTINKMKGYITARTGNPTKPSGTGFGAFAASYKKARTTLKGISACFDAEPYKEEVLLGRLAEKGDVIQHRTYLINPAHATKVSYLREKVKATPLKSLVKAIAAASSIEQVPYADLASKIAGINKFMEEMGLSSLRDCLGVTSSVSCGNDMNYEPSNGERAMLILAHALFDDNASIYILDEPEAGMGNEFINKVVVDRINCLAKLNKVVVISTHNANVAVRTLPWQSVYREYGAGEYRTYVGNPFSDELIDLAGKDASKSWTQISMETLEGGETAFTDRELAYGKLA